MRTEKSTYEITEYFGTCPICGKEEKTYDCVDVECNDCKVKRCNEALQSLIDLGFIVEYADSTISRIKFNFKGKEYSIDGGIAGDITHLTISTR